MNNKLKTGLAIHCHHDTLIEWCYDYDERIVSIKYFKSENERETRLRLFRLLSKKAIADLPQELVRIYMKRRQINAEYDQAFIKWYWTNIEEWDRAYAKWKRTIAELEQLPTEWNDVNKKAWHDKWCGCKEWDGKQIVFSKD